MPYEKFDPRGRRPTEKRESGRNQPNSFIVAIQLAGIFLMVRLVMLVSGVTFIGIPYLDHFLVGLIKMFSKQ